MSVLYCQSVSTASVGFFAVLAVLVLTGFFVQQAEDLRFVYWGIPSALILAGALNTSFLNSGHKCMQFIGDASYSIYLSHVIGITVMAMVWQFLPSVFIHQP